MILAVMILFVVQLRIFLLAHHVVTLLDFPVVVVDEDLVTVVERAVAYSTEVHPADLALEPEAVA